jgi:glutaminase
MKLEMSSAMPLNPFINAGAIVIAGLIVERTGGKALEDILAFASRMAGLKEELAVCERVYISEKSTADRNRALAYFMHSVGTLRSNVEETLDLYFRLCSISVNTPCLAAMGATLANGGVNPSSGARVVSLGTVYTIIGIMSVCGLYDESGEFAVKVGVPAKSGVSGGILCAAPGRMGIAVFSPPLGTGGNSIAGIAALAKLSGDLKLRGI